MLLVAGASYWLGTPRPRRRRRCRRLRSQARPCLCRSRARRSPRSRDRAAAASVDRLTLSELVPLRHPRSAPRAKPRRDPATQARRRSAARRRPNARKRLRKPKPLRAVAASARLRPLLDATAEAVAGARGRRSARAGWSRSARSARVHQAKLGWRYMVGPIRRCALPAVVGRTAIRNGRRLLPVPDRDDLAGPFRSAVPADAEDPLQLRGRRAAVEAEGRAVSDHAPPTTSSCRGCSRSRTRTSRAAFRRARCSPRWWSCCSRR